MSIGKVVTLGVMAVLAWQFQAPLKERMELAGHLGTIVTTYMEMSSYRAALRSHIEKERNPPRAVSTWLDENFQAKGARPASIDQFGARYTISRGDGREWLLRSCGPDVTCFTDDDLVLSLTGD